MKSIGIIGSGTMGLGMAQVFALKNFEVILYDINQNALTKAKEQIFKNLAKAVEIGKLLPEELQASQQNLHFTTDFDRLRADMFIEAVVEKLEVKIDLFKKLAGQNESNCVLASNTSSIPITQIASGVPNPERVLGVHFFNPAHIMKLVEVISGAHTKPEIARQVFELIEKIGKVPVMAKDSPGFIVNRVARHYYVEALKLLEEGVADIETIDLLMERLGFKMGPFRLMDLIGVDTNFSVTNSMFEQFYFDEKFRPSRIQKQKVDAGFHGRKTAKGFYTYEK